MAQPYGANDLERISDVTLDLLLPERVSYLSDQFDVDVVRRLTSVGSIDRWLVRERLPGGDSAAQMQHLAQLHTAPLPAEDTDTNALLAFLELHADRYSPSSAAQSEKPGQLIDLVVNPEVGVGWLIDSHLSAQLGEIAARRPLGLGNLGAVLIGMVSLIVRALRIGWCLGDVTDASRVIVSESGSFSLLPFVGMHHLTAQLASVQDCFCANPTTALRKFAEGVSDTTVVTLLEGALSGIDRVLTEEEALEAFIHDVSSTVEPQGIALPESLVEFRFLGWPQRPRLQGDSSPGSGSEPRQRHQQFDGHNSERGRPSNGQRFLHRVLSRRQLAS